MSVFHKGASAIAGVVKSVFNHDKAGKVVREGIDVLEAASLNKDHKHVSASKPEHLKIIFAIAAGCAAVGISVPVIGTGWGVAAVSIFGLETAKLLSYRGLRVVMPYDPERINNPAEPKGLKNMVHNTLDFFEAVSLSKTHPWMAASDKKSLGGTFLASVAGIGAGVGLMAGTVGLPALAGVAITEAGKFAAYRGYRIIFPFQSGLEPSAP